MDTLFQMEERLWDLIDGRCSPAERLALEGLIGGNSEWQLKYGELLEVHQSMAAAEPEVPSLRFTRNVMEEIALHRVAPATNSHINKHIIRGIAAFFVLTLAAVLVYFLAEFKGSGIGLGTGPSGGASIDDLSSYDQAFQNHLDKINWGRIFNSTYVNIFIMVNLILGLMLLDRYLHYRKQRVM